MFDKFKHFCRNNPEAFRNTVARMLEAAGRGIWKADESTLAQLKNMYSDLDDEMENVK